jgi:hypothetical protein
MLTASKAFYNQHLARVIHISTVIHKERKKEAKKERKATTTTPYQSCLNFTMKIWAACAGNLRCISRKKGTATPFA